ncbi:MAG: hypothetical protein EP298_09020 [Gammaproteobacteria bacterium]|nr:MAG: hypothetical protein EP298_09020 [Gammaproteobacteria bacterium]UTW42374.1 hypothetical protein KFE69_12970 [bacterium SCSIO 12844]
MKTQLYCLLALFSLCSYQAQADTISYPVKGHDRCLCTFDMDYTIDYPGGLNGAAQGAIEAIQVCMAHHCGIAINSTEQPLNDWAYSHYWNPGTGLTPNQEGSIYQYIYKNQTKPSSKLNDLTVNGGYHYLKCTSNYKVCQLPKIIDAYNHTDMKETKMKCVFHFDDSYSDLVSLNKAYGDQNIHLIYVRSHTLSQFFSLSDPNLGNDLTGIWYSNLDSNAKILYQDIDNLISSTSC